MTIKASARRGPSIAVQIIALLVAVLIIGQLATLAVVVILPPPRPPIYRIEEIAAALKTGRSTPRDAPPLVRTTGGALFKEHPGDRRAAMLKADLARDLGVSTDAVLLNIEHPHFSFPFAPTPRLHRRNREPGRPEDEGPPPPPDMSPGAPIPTASPADQTTPPPVSVTGAATDPAPATAPEPSPWGRGGFRRRRGGFGPWSPLDRMGLVVGRVEAAYSDAPGRWVQVRTPDDAFPNAWQRRLMLWLLACLAVLTPIGYLFARRLSAPIRRFASAAERLGRDPAAPPLAVGGPAEIGLAAAAFNEMQARLARYVQDRTSMIGAIAHDLRTPLARVQFKLNRAPPDLAADIRSDLDQMEAMVAAVLDFVRNASAADERTLLDLLSVLEVVADDASDVGADVEVRPGPSLVVEGDATGLQRLFMNLVDNAVKYGGKARIRLYADGGEAVVEVTDEGPGLTPEEIERVFEPFYRVESSRNRETGGIGLGLSVARTIARAHGGEVTLSSTGRGLTATVRLPGARAAG